MLENATFWDVTPCSLVE